MCSLKSQQETLNTCMAQLTILPSGAATTRQLPTTLSSRGRAILGPHQPAAPPTQPYPPGRVKYKTHQWGTCTLGWERPFLLICTLIKSRLDVQDL